MITCVCPVLIKIATLLHLKNVAGIIRGWKLLEVLDAFFSFRGTEIIRSNTVFGKAILGFSKIDE